MKVTSMRQLGAKLSACIAWYSAVVTCPIGLLWRMFWASRRIVLRIGNKDAQLLFVHIRLLIMRRPSNRAMCYAEGALLMKDAAAMLGRPYSMNVYQVMLELDARERVA